MEYYIYEWIRLDTNEPFYVGKGKDNRAYDNKKNKHFMDIVNYCSKNNVEVCVHILDDNLNETTAYELEVWYIHDYIINFGFNMANKSWGGEGGDIVSMMSIEEKKLYSKKMSESLKGKNTGARSQEVKDKISRIRIENGLSKGENNPMYRKDVKDFMDEASILRWKANISKSNIGKTHSEETKIKMSKARYGINISEEARLNMSASRMGNKNHRYGTHLSDTHKKIISETHSKPIVLEINDIKLQFKSRNECLLYIENNYGLSSWSCKEIIKSNKPYEPTQKRYNKLRGLRLYYI